MTDVVIDPPAQAPEPSSENNASVPEAAAGASRYALTGRDAAETLVGTAVWSYLWSMFLCASLNLFHTGDVKYLIAITLRHQFVLFALSAAVVWVVVLLVLSITGRLWLTCGLTLSMVVGLGMVDRTKMAIRLEPVYPSDLDFLRSPGFLFEMVTPGKLIGGFLGLATITAVVILLGRIPQKTFRPIRRSITPGYWRNLLVVRVALALLCVIALNYATTFNHENNKLRAAFEASGVKWAWWYQDLNYGRNGFVAGLLYNMLAEPMQPPPGYSKQAMAEVAARWKSEADAINASRTGSLDDVNVVSILSEAFSDPTTVHGTTVTGDPIPFTRNLMTHVTSGAMLAQLYGGGTANMEFETLSGQSLSMFEPQVNTPYQQFVHSEPDYSTIAGYFKRLDHRPIAIHPYMTAMYQRKAVYKVFGFDEFIHDSTMHEARKIDHSKFISDQSAFDEVDRQLTTNQKPLFVNLVTMQNHVPMANSYHDPWPVSGDSGLAKKSLAGYARGINYSDKAMQNFLSGLATSKEKTAVIFYGDHRPGIYPSQIRDANSQLNIKSTPFFIWTNFKTPKISTAAFTSPIYFMPLLFEQTDAKVPPYYALLTEMYHKMPAMEQNMRLDWSGTEETTLDPAAKQMLDDYRLVQYDLSVGRHYAAAQMFYPLS